ncbi:MAG: hypothetical protein ACK47B_07590 [Armatimonadota bacterium]
MKDRLLLAILVFSSFVGGCAPQEARTLGNAPSGDPATVGTARKAASGTSLMLAGEMVEKCPVAGCWFEVRDQSGIIRVDTKNAGFVVLDVPLKTHVTVAGRIKVSDGEPQLEATGLRY